MIGIGGLFDISGKVVLLTGGTQGIGYVLARAISEAGAEVVVTGRRKDKVGEAVANLKSDGVSVRGYAADVSDECAMAELVDDVCRAYGCIDVLINNAGVRVNKPALEIAAEEWDWLMSVNLRGVFLPSRLVASRMVERGGGKIINMSSVFAQIVMNERAPYCASKAGVSQLTKALASEWAKYNINVNAVAPGYIKTTENEGRVRHDLLAAIPAGRFGSPEDLVGVTIFLASRASDYVTGQTFIVDGGWSLW